MDGPPTGVWRPEDFKRARPVVPKSTIKVVELETCLVPHQKFRKDEEVSGDVGAGQKRSSGNRHDSCSKHHSRNDP